MALYGFETGPISEGVSYVTLSEVSSPSSHDLYSNYEADSWKLAVNSWQLVLCS